MRLRSTFLFLCLVAAPLVLIAWICLMLLKEQRGQAREVWTRGVQGRLADADRLLTEEMTRLADGLDSLLKETALTEAALYDLPRHQPMVRTAFLLDPRGRVVYPQRNGQTQGEASAFLRRSEAVWETGLRISKAVAWEQAESLSQIAETPPAVSKQEFSSASISESGETFLKKADSRPTLKSPIARRKSEPNVMASGWHVWYYGNGPQMLFWQEREDGRVVGVDVEMAAVVSLLLNRLSGPDLPPLPGLMRLISQDGDKVLHQWGQSNMEDAREPVAARPCTAPLGMWQLDYRPAPHEAPQSDPTAVLLGAGGAGLVLVALAYLFYRESTREMREARRRVSFVNQVSHELKTPLTNIRLYAEMAQQRVEDAGDEVASRQLAVVEAETSRLSRLIHNVLTFARQQRSQLTVQLRRASLDEVVARVVTMWRPSLEEKEFEVCLELGSVSEFRFDPDAVEQILGNLLSNVEKYAASGKYVRVTTSATAAEARVCVIDRGPGVPRRYQESIFAPFVRVRSDLTEGVSGSGIGLGIARQLAALQGGTVRVAPGSESGAMFILTLSMNHENPHR